MRVLIVRGFPEKLNINDYNVQEIGLAHALREKGIICDIVFFNGNNHDSEQMLIDGTKILWLHGINLLKNGVMPGVRKLAEDYDVLQVHEYDQMESWIVYTMFRKPVVIYHGPYYDPFNRGYNAKTAVFDRTLLPLSGKARKNVICLTKSELAADYLRGKGFQKVRAVGVGFNPDNMEKEDKSRGISDIPVQSSSDDIFQLLYVGKLEERRNIDFLLDVIQKAVEKTERLHATIVGTGEESYVSQIQPQMNDLIRRGCLTYIPKASQTELSTIYKKTDVLLFPTKYDIFGMVLLEAMYYGVSVISSVNGGASVLIDHQKNGVVLRNFDVNLWVNQILWLASHPSECREMGERAATTIRTKYVWSALADQFIAAYKEAENSFSSK